VLKYLVESENLVIEEELKTRLERSLRKEIPRTVCKKLDRGGWTEDYHKRELEQEGGEEANFQALREQVREELAYLEEYEREMAGVTEESDMETEEEREEETGSSEYCSKYFEPDLGEYEKERRLALAEWMARQADNDEDVANFRSRYLEGRVLEGAQAYAFLESPAARYFPAEWFEGSYSSPEHAAEIVSYDRGVGKSEIDHRVKVEINPPGVARTVRYAPYQGSIPGGEPADYRVCAYRDEAHTVPKPPHSWPLSYRDKYGLKETVFPWPTSLLYELRERSILLAKTYDWKEEDAVWFFLTGEPPNLGALTLAFRISARSSKATINLKVASWVSPDVVKKNYQKVQSLILTERPHELPIRSLTVFRFVERKTRERGELPSWPELLEAWKAEHPEWAYENFRGLRQAYYRTRNNLLPSYRLPESKPLPLEAQTDLEKRFQRIRERAEAIGGPLTSRRDGDSDSYPTVTGANTSER